MFRTLEEYKHKKRLTEADVKDKRVFLRVDFNVPMTEGEITDDSKIRGAVPTIKYLVDRRVKSIFVGTHLGRATPEKHKDVDGGVMPLVERLNRILGEEDLPLFTFKSTRECLGEPGSPRWIFVENLRSIEGEKNPEKGTGPFDSFVYSNCDLIVSDCFGVMHRNDYSVVGTSLERVSGLLVDREMNNLGRLVEGGRLDLIIMGGSKLEDKISLISELSRISDRIFVGGRLSIPFELGEGVTEGIRQALGSNKTKLLLPLDYTLDDLSVIGRELVSRENKDRIMDIGTESTALLREVVGRCKRVFWNGTLGKTEDRRFRRGSMELVAAIKERESGSIVGVGGGDTAGFVSEIGERDSFDIVCTGGGCPLEILEGKLLPGIRALSDA
jgi:phosphoglycerate kinase